MLGEAPLAERRERPLVFTHELIFDPDAQCRREDFPCVGFHLRVLARVRMRLHPIKRAEQVVARVAERRTGRGVQRQVKMHAPLVVGLRRHGSARASGKST